MAYFDPSEAFDTLKTRVADSVQKQFPVEGAKNTLVANKVWVDDNLDSDDIRGQKEAKQTGRTWAVPVRAELELRDKSTGKVKDRKVVTVAQLPKITRRYSYIVGGNEYQVNNLFRLKSGVYSRIAANGELEGQWNLAKGLGFRMKFDPESKKMALKYQSGATVPLYPVLKTMGVSDDDLERSWGKEILSANMEDKEEPTLRKFFKTFNGINPETVEESRKFLQTEFGKSELRPDSTKMTLGKPFSKVDGSALLEGSHKLLKVARGEEKPDDRDSLAFKDLLSTEDLLGERIDTKHRWEIQRKLKNTLDKHQSVRAIVNPDFFGKPIRSFFANSSVSERPDQMNPISFTAGNRRTTLMGPGEGGMSSAHQLSLEAESINPSHVGFLDVIQTPEGERTGVNLQLASGVKKVGKELKIRVYNTKTKKLDWITPVQATTAVLAFPDQYNWKGEQPIPIGKAVKVSDKDGTITAVDPKNVEYVLKSTKGMFDIAANLIPFLQSDQGNRTMVATKQLEQAVPLVSREQPLVQVKGDKANSFEHSLGNFNSHHSPVAGVVKQVKKDAVVIHDNDGNRHEVQIYHDFPLNDSHSVLNSTARVTAGDKVTKGQLLADSNFTKDGVLALGTNLRVAYTPYKGYNFEDGIVISEAAAKKLTSEHMHRESVTEDVNILLHKNKFLAASAGKVTKEQADKLDDRGIIREGEIVQPGDILIGALKKEEVRPEDKQLALFSKKLVKPVRPRTQTWERDTPGIVNQVVTHGGKTTVYVKTLSPATIGDKIVGRHGNKGIITSVIPVGEMPHDKDGVPIDVLLNPTGVPTRINLGQVLETAASKIAKKTGTPYLVNNFDPTNTDYTRNLEKELKKHGVSDTEDLVDPRTGKEMKDVLVGDQYILKLHHMVEKKLQTRSRDAYDSNMTPKGGGPKGGQSMDALGLYALLAHNARHNIREFQSYKSDFNDDFWTAIQAGEPIPPPKVPFVHKKFEGYLRGMGLDVRKDGNSMILGPITDAKVLELSEGRTIKDPGLMLRAKDARPEKDGLFDSVATGTVPGKLGDKWSHFPLAASVPNPIFEKPMRALLNLTENQFDDIIRGDDTLDGKTGPGAIVDAIKTINPKKELSSLVPQLDKLKGTALNKVNKKVKYLQALEKANMSPTDAYVTSLVPVMPAAMRPFAVLDDGRIKYDDVNEIYKHIGTLNDQVRKIHPAMLDEDKTELHASLYDGMKSLAMTGVTSRGRHFSGIAETLAGKTQPKEGFFQKRVIGRRQDMSMRGTIVPEPALSLDEVGLPRKAATELYKPFTIRRLVRLGYTPLQAQQQVNEGTALAKQALETEVSERPILLKRDPVLHKFGVQAFKPVLVDGKATKIHPLVTGGYNADFDGDTMSAFVPISQDAVREAYRMVPSRNLFSPATGKVMLKPGHEALLGLFKMSEFGKDIGKNFPDAGALAEAVQKGQVKMTDVVSIKDTAKVMGIKLGAAGARTTAGRMLLYNAMPEGMKDTKILTDPDYIFNKKVLSEVLSRVGTDHNSDFSRVADALKDMGNSYSTGMSFGLKDFESMSKARDPIFAVAAKEEAKIRASSKPTAAKNKAVVDLYVKAGQEVDRRVKAEADRSSNRVYDWIRSGARGDFDQFKQMVSAPILVADSNMEPVPIPITRSYSEGLDIGSYWAAMYGARMGTIGKAQGTSEPGAISKQMSNVTMSQMVSSEDCGTERGIALPTEDRDTLGRYTAEDIKLGIRGGKDKGSIPKGTLVDTALLNRLKNNKIDAVTVRSPLKCAHGRGICAKCYGLNENGQNHELGANIGIMASQALGEPATQLSMNAFHTGGVVGAKGSSMDNFLRLKQLLEVPQKLPGAATLASEDGTVEKVSKDPAGGWNVFVKGVRHYVPERLALTVSKGSTVRKGDSLTDGPKNPHELLSLTNMGAVQNYLTNEIHRIYQDGGPVKRRNVETFVRALTNLGRVDDPGSHPDFIPGDKAPLSVVQEFNEKVKAKNEKPIVVTPLLKSVAMLPKELETDWIARMNSGYIKDTIVDAAAEGWKTRVHSTHPIPAMAVGKEFGLGTPEEPWLY